MGERVGVENTTGGRGGSNNINISHGKEKNNLEKPVIILSKTPRLTRLPKTITKFFRFQTTGIQLVGIFESCGSLTPAHARASARP
jgi:hypothetical protein